MKGIYRIFNKLTNKSYIGQSIHCGKRLDEHLKGCQLIDDLLQIEGVENFGFEILKEVSLLLKNLTTFGPSFFSLKVNFFLNCLAYT